MARLALLAYGSGAIALGEVSLNVLKVVSKQEIAGP